MFGIKNKKQYSLLIVYAVMLNAIKFNMIYCSSTKARSQFWELTEQLCRACENRYVIRKAEKSKPETGLHSYIIRQCQVAKFTVCEAGLLKNLGSQGSHWSS